VLLSSAAKCEGSPTKMLLTTFLSKSYKGKWPWGLTRRQLSKEANMCPVHCSEEKTNLQSLRGIPHEEGTTKEAWVSINMTPFPRILGFWGIITSYATHRLPHGYTLIAKFHHSPP